MISSAELGTRQLSMLVDAAERIGRLPAIVTQDWCDLAAGLLVPLRPGSVCCVTVGHTPSDAGERGFKVDACGGATDARGVGASSIAAVHTDGAKSIGWGFSDASAGQFAQGGPGLEARVARLRDLPSWSSWPITTAGKRWSRLGITELLVGRATLSASDQTRAVFVEMGLPREQATFTRVEAILLGSLLEPLRRRAAAAFGPIADADAHRITKREQVVLEQLTLGRTVREIADHLDRSPHTVHDHVKALHRKLDANSRGELIARYLGFTTGADGGLTDGAGADADAGAVHVRGGVASAEPTG